MIKTVTTTTGVNIINFGNTADRYYWCKNIGETTLYVSAKEDISPDTDDVAILEPGDIVMIETYNQDIYVLGVGKIQIYETETNTCPFKAGVKGGDLPDFSEFAKKTDIPAELPANGGNADYATNAGNAEKLGGKSASIYYSDDNFPIKSTDITTGTDEYGSARLWKISEGKTPIFAYCSNNSNYICTPFLGDQSLETWYIAVDNAINNHTPITSSNAVTFKVYYI